MDLTLIILNYKTVGLARQCLKSIRSANPNLQYEVIIVDNASGDKVAEMVKDQFPEVKVIESSFNSG